MRILVPILLALVSAGCVSVPDSVPAAGADGAELADASVAAPQVFEWSGHVIASELETPTHFQPTEQVFWPVFQEGILFDVQEMPQVMEVALEWTGGGEYMIMLHSHKEHGTNVYAEHITGMDATNPKCLRVPVEDLATGAWQVMVHSQGVRQGDFKLTIGLVGGAGSILKDERHGHWPQDGNFEIDEREIEECRVLGAPTA